MFGIIKTLSWFVIQMSFSWILTLMSWIDETKTKSLTMNLWKSHGLKEKEAKVAKLKAKLKAVRKEKREVQKDKKALITTLVNDLKRVNDQHSTLQTNHEVYKFKIFF